MTKQTKTLYLDILVEFLKLEKILKMLKFW